MKNHLPVFLITCIVIYISFIAFTHRATFLKPFDAEYWKERYEQSQWRLLFSSRIIGDDGLYLSQGYLLSKGADPSIHNPEAPPVGKYIIGANIFIFRNGNITGFFTMTASLCSFFFLCFLILKKKTTAVFLTLLLAMDPLFTDQFHLTMLDGIQLLFFLLTAISFSLKRPAFAGIFLSLAAGTKAPVVIPPIIVIISIVYLLKKDVKSTAIFLLSFGLLYILPYLQYFRLGHSLHDWISLQKYIAGTYLSSKLQANYGSLVTTLFLNTSQNLFTKQWGTGTFFSPLWPCITLGGIIGIYILIKKKIHEASIFIATLLFSSFLIFSFLPFWTRYLVSFLPFLYLTSTLTFERLVSKSKYKRYIPIVGITIILIQFSSVLPHFFPSQDTEMKELLYNFKHGFFHDIYEKTSQQTKQQYSRKDFDRIGKSFYSGAQIEHVEIKLKNNNQIDIKYTTRFLGSLYSSATIPFIKEHGQWRIVWDWRFIHPDFSPDAQTITHVDLAKRGKIVQNAEILASDDESIFITIDPKTLDKTREKELYEFLASMFDNMHPAYIHHRVVFDNLNNNKKAIGTVPNPPDKKTLEKLLSYQGVQITSAYTRNSSPNAGKLANTIYTECCTRLYSISTYHGISGYEKDFDDQLSGENGGSIILLYPDGKKKEILRKEKKNGTDVMVTPP